MNDVILFTIKHYLASIITPFMDSPLPYNNDFVQKSSLMFRHNGKTNFLFSFPQSY